MLDQILKSSTPDGLAPMSLLALQIATFVISGLSILWGAVNFVMLLRVGPQNKQDGLIIGNSQSEQVREMGFKVLTQSLHYMKFNFIVIFGATLIYFLTILGAIEVWSQVTLSVCYLLGTLASFLCSIFTVVTTSFSYFRIIYAAKYSVSDSFCATKNASNSITFVCLGVTLASLMAIVLYFNPIDKHNIDEINNRANQLLSFAFGYVTVCICTKISSLLYSRGIQNSFQLSSMFDLKNLKKDSHHPMVICKIIGETVNRSLSKSLDFLTFIPCIVAIVMKVAGINIIGADQNGEIIFQLSSDNSFTCLLLVGFGLIFTIIFSFWKGSPQNDEQVKMHFRINIVGITVFLSGFTALACYLTLPAQFQLQQFVLEDNLVVMSPLYAYLIVLIGMFVCLLISFTAEIQSSGLSSIYGLMKSCKTGAATCLISGLSKGYFYTFVPIVIIASFGFLCYFWLGNFGIGLGTVGISLFVPYYMNACLYHSIMNCVSMVAFITKQAEDATSVQSLLALNESKRTFQHKIYVFYNQVVTLLTYTIIAVFAQHSNQRFSIQEPHLFLGLLIGAMVPYVFSALLINGSYAVAPVICYDLQQQLQQNPNAIKGKAELDCHRSNHLFTLNCTIKILKFLPLLILPTIITGVGLSLQSTLGLIVGLAISSIQFSISSSMSGSLWRNVRDEIACGRAKDEDNQDIGMDSQWGKAAEIGSLVGSNIKQSSGQSAFIYVLWTAVLAVLFEDLFIEIHSD